MKTIDQHIEKMKAEILGDMASGLVPKTVASFSELHDYVDANEYGGFVMAQGSVGHINKCQNAVDAWIKVRGFITPSEVAA